MSEHTETTEQEQASGSKKSLLKPIIFIGVLIALFVCAKVFNLGEQLKNVQGWIESLGPWGPLAFIALYVGATVAAIPGSALTLLAGAIFGSFWGVVWVSIGSTLGAALCFLIARYIARDSIEARMSQNPLFQKLDTMAEKQGAIIVAITRLVPIFPFNLLNYGFGLTKVGFGTYVIASWACMLPGTALYVVGADAVKTAIQKGEIPWHLVGLVLVALLLVIGVAKLAKGKLSDDTVKDI